MAEMRSATPLLFALMAGIAASGPAAADHEPSFVLPDRFGRPVIVDGLDVTGAVIEGDWGLYRPGHGRRVIYDADSAARLDPRGYFPATGRPPRRGRLEIEPPPAAPHPRPADPYYRQWGTQSGPAAATILPPYDPPPVIVAPRLGERARRPVRRAH